MEADTKHETFSEDAIQKAFNLFDLDKNGYVGFAELKHLLIMMGELITDEEIDMMISMLDRRGDNQVAYNEFRAMALSEDPITDDILDKKMTSPDELSRSASIVQQQKRRTTFLRVVQTARIDKADVYQMMKAIRDQSSSRHLTNQDYQLNNESICALMPAMYYSKSDCREIYDMLRNEEEETIDSRDLIMTFASFVTDFDLEEKCRLAFDMYDVDRSGYLSVNEVEACMSSTNLIPRELIKQRVDTFMKCADTDRTGDLTPQELLCAAEKLPNLLFPSHK